MKAILIDHDSFFLSQGDFKIRLLVAIGIDGVIGFERQLRAIKEYSQEFAGIRTFISLVLLGSIAALFYFLFSPWVYRPFYWR